MVRQQCLPLAAGIFAEIAQLRFWEFGGESQKEVLQILNNFGGK